jgi:hypothetical protein
MTHLPKSTGILLLALISLVACQSKYVDIEIADENRGRYCYIIFTSDTILAPPGKKLQFDSNNISFVHNSLKPEKGCIRIFSATGKDISSHMINIMANDAYETVHFYCPTEAEIKNHPHYDEYYQQKLTGHNNDLGEYLPAELEAFKNVRDSSNGYFPFIIQNFNGQFGIEVQTKGPELYPKYADFFEQFGYSGNGYCWEGHIIQMLEKLDKESLAHIDFDPEAGSFFCVADSEQSQKKFLTLLSPYFPILQS